MQKPNSIPPQAQQAPASPSQVQSRPETVRPTIQTPPAPPQTTRTQKASGKTSEAPNLVSVQQLQNILIPMHQLMKKQDEEIKRLKSQLKQEAVKSEATLASLQALEQAPQASQIAPQAQQSPSHSTSDETSKALQAELKELKALVLEQSKQIKAAQTQVLQTSAMIEMGQGPYPKANQKAWSLGKLSNGLGEMMNKLGSSLGKLTPKRPKTFEEIKALTSSEDLPLPPPVPVYDPFNEPTPIDTLKVNDTPFEDQESGLAMEHWKAEESPLLHTPVVTNAPQAIASVDVDDDEQEDLDISFESDEGDEETPFKSAQNDQIIDEEILESNEQALKQQEQNQINQHPFPVMGNNDPQALQFNVGGLTMSRFQSAGPDPQLMSMIMQHTQLLKRQEHNTNQVSSRVKKQEEMNQTQNEIIEQLVSRTQREQDKLNKRVKKLERTKDTSQKNAQGLKAHHKRLSQLEMLIEGFEAKLAAFDEKLSSKDPTKQATDIRVSLDPDEGDYQSIQEAIDAAPVGAYIGIMPGIYQDPLEITKPVKLIGLGRPQDILIQVKEESALVINRMGGVYEESMSSSQEKEVRKKLQQYTGIEASTMGSQVMKWFKKQLGQPVADDSVFEAKVGTDEVSLVSLTIASITTEVGGTPSERPAILIRSGHLRLEKCEVRCENGHGVILEGEAAEFTTRACRIIQARGSGVLLRTRAQATLASTAIVKCKESGIDGQGYTSIRLMDCDISNNQRIGVQVGFKSQLIAYHTIMAGNHFEGLWMNNQSTGTVKGCDLRGNARGPYDISTDCRVEMISNKP